MPTLLRATLLLSLLFAAACGPSDDDVIVIDTSESSQPDGEPDSETGENTTDQDDASATDCADCETGEYSEELAFCVAFLNELRARVDQPPLERSADLEECAAAAAASDAESGQPHGYFQQTSGCNFTARAENEVPGWSADRFGGVRGVVEAGAEMMFDEGPGGGHYENIVGDHTRAGCGIHVTDANDVWVVHNFR